MSPTTRARSARTPVAVPDEASTEPLNEVRLRGRLAAEPTTLDLPSGDRAAVFRLVVPRPPERRKDGARGARVDALECTVYTAALRRTVSRLLPGDIVEVTGTLQRRFSRAAGPPVSRYAVVGSAVVRVARAVDAERATMAW